MPSQAMKGSVVGSPVYPHASAADPSPADLANLEYLHLLFEATADSIQQSIATRPMVGLAGSPYSIDFKPDSLAERSLLSFALPGVLGLLQGIRGNARALALLYGRAGPALIDPAPFELMRGAWEKSLMTAWLLDGDISSLERVGRLKGWIEQGVSRDAVGPDSLPTQTSEAIREMLVECPALPIPPLGWVDLSKRHAPSGESVYRRLSGVLHGRVWSVIPAFVTAWGEHGHAVAWRGYAPSLHRDLAEEVVQLADSAARTVDFYFGGGAEA